MRVVNFLEKPSEKPHKRASRLAIRRLIARAMKNFHCLGLGAPVMLPIPAAAHHETTLLTTDATSPIHDAVRDRVLYNLEKDGHRESTHEIVQRIVDGGQWPSISPFIQSFQDEFGHHPDRARAAWETLGRPTIDRAFLEIPNDVTKALPLFAATDANVLAAARRAHIAHNHWVLDRLTEALANEGSRQQVALSVLNRTLSGTSTVTTRGVRAALQVLMRDV